MARGFGGTMGQDWGGRRRSNPDGIKRVTAEQVRAAALKIGVQVKRATGWSMWWILRPGDEWRTLADTNYRALCYLQNTESDGQAVVNE